MAENETLEEQLRRLQEEERAAGLRIALEHKTSGSSTKKTDIISKLKESGINIAEFLKTPEGARFLVEAGIMVGAELAIPVPGSGVLPRMLRTGAMGGTAAITSLGTEPIAPSDDPAARAAMSGLMGAGFDVIGGLIPRTLAPAPGLVTKKGREASDLVSKLAQQRGMTGFDAPRITAGQMSESRFVRLLEGVADASIMGRGAIRGVKQNTAEFLQQEIETFASRLRTVTTPEEAGQIVQNTIEDEADLFIAMGKAKYKQIDDAMRGRGLYVKSGEQKPGQTLAVTEGESFTGPVSIKVVKERLLDYMASRGRIKSVGLDQLKRQIINKPDVLSFGEAHQMRSDLLGIGRQGQELVGGQAQGIAKDLAKVIDTEMEKAAVSVKTPGALNAWRDANEFWRDGKTKFNDRFIKALVKRDPDAVVSAVIRPRRPVIVRRVRETMNDLEKWKAVQGEWMADQMSRSVDLEGKLSGDALQKALNTYGKETLTELFPDGTAANLSQLVNALRVAESKGTGTDLSIFVQVTQAGALFNLLKTPLSAIKKEGAADVGILLTPSVFARLVTSKTGIKWLTDGLIYGPTLERGSRAIAQIAAYAIREQEKIDKERLELSSKGSLEEKDLFPPDFKGRAFGGGAPSQAGFSF